MAAAKAEPARSFWRGDFVGALLCGGLVTLFSLLLLWRDPSVFWNDDYQVSILPVFADMARSWSEGQLPLLSPYSWVCSNLAGEFQYGTFSVFVNAAVVLIWKLPLNFAQQAAALSISHLFVLSMGGYLLARDRKLSPALATMVGLIAPLNGWIICWGASDWFGALGAFAWFPWAWWGLERALDPRRRSVRFLWPVPFIYLLIAGGFPYTVVMLALLVAWLALRSIVQTGSLLFIWPVALGMLLGVGLSAPAWLALFDYLSGSARETQESSAHFQWIVPPAALPAFFLPAWTVNWSDFSTRLRPHTATEMACGIVAPAALLFAFIVRGRSFVRRFRWELGLLIVVLVISMLPTANVFRWSFRWLPFVHLVLAICAAEALAIFAAERKVAFAALGIFCLLGLAMWICNTAGPFGWFFLPTMGVLALIWCFAGGSWAAAAMTFASLLATYIVIPPNCGVPRYNLDQRLTSAAPLDPARLYLSLYPAAEEAYRADQKPEPFGTIVRIGSTSMWGGVHLINGYSPIRPAGVAREFGFSIHGEIAPWAAEYFPVYKGGPEDELAQIGVDGIIIASEMEIVPQPETEWQLVHSSTEGRVYHRRGAPFARVRGNREAKVRVIEDSRQRVVAEVETAKGDQPTKITFSRPFFRGYRARFNDRELPVDSVRNLMPTVEIPAGESGRLVLTYRPWWLMYGGAAAALCGLFSLGALVAGARRSG